MQRNLLLGIGCLVLGIVAVLAADAKFGAPWGFQGKRAAVLEVVGSAELHPSTTRKDGRTQKLAEHMFLVPGDEIRTSGASSVRLKLPEGDLLLGPGSQVKIESVGVAVMKGRVEGRVSATQVPVRVPALPGTIELDSATFTLVSDGRATAAMQLREGKGRAALSSSTWSAGVAPATLFMKRPDGAQWNKPPAPMELRATCQAVDKDTMRIAGAAAIGVEVFVGSRLVFPDENARFEVRVAAPRGESVTVVGRDYTGAATTLRVKCPGA